MATRPRRGSARPHAAYPLKPQAAAIETNLTIYTTRRIYHVILRSRGRAMREVQFYYPEDSDRHGQGRCRSGAGASRQAAASNANPRDSGGGEDPAAGPAQLNFG